MTGDAGTAARRRAAYCGLAAAAVGPCVYAAIAGLGFWRDDYPLRAFVAREGVLGAVVAGATRRYCDFTFDFWRPLTVATIAVESALFGGCAPAYRAVSYALLAWTAWSLFRLVRRDDPRRAPAALAGAALFAASPALVESVRWAIAGQQDLWALAFGAAAAVAAVRRSPASFVASAAACLTKETAYVLPAVVAATVLSRPSDRPRRRDLAFVLLHAALTTGIFLCRSRVLGGFRTPYATESGGAFVAAAATALAQLPAAAARVVGWPALTVGALAVAYGAAAFPRRTVLGAAVSAVALAPILSLPLGGATPCFGGRYFLPLVVATAYAAGTAAAGAEGRRAKWMTAAVAIAACAGAAIRLPEEFATARSVADDTQALVAAVDRCDTPPGRALLLGGVDPATAWVFPAAQSPPWRAAARTVYEIRPGAGFGEPLTHLRPLEEGISVAARTPTGIVVFDAEAESGPATKPVPRFVRGADGAVGLAAPVPLRAAGWLRLRGPAGTSATLRVGFRFEGAEGGLERTVPLSPTVDAVVPLVDVVAAPRAVLQNLRIEGADSVVAGPPPPLALRWDWPPPDSALSFADAPRPFEFGEWPTGTEAVRLTLYTGAGAAQFVMMGRAFSLQKVAEDSGGSLIAVLAASAAVGGDDLCVGVEALADVALPWSTLDRTAVRRFRLVRPARN